MNGEWSIVNCNWELLKRINIDTPPASVNPLSAAMAKQGPFSGFRAHRNPLTSRAFPFSFIFMIETDAQIILQTPFFQMER